MHAIELHDLTRSYGPRRAVDALSLTVPEGSLFGFLGPNGAGKTTAIRVLLGLLRPTSGRAVVLGRDAWRDSARIKRDTGYIPGDFRIYPWMNTRDTLRIFGAARGVDLAAPGRALADRFALDPAVKARRMSRGMRQKLGLILALAHDPALLILDEPSTTLDPLMQDELRAILRERAARGRTVFFSSHTLSEVEALCDRVAIIREGRLIASQTLQELRRRAGRDVSIRWKGVPPCDPPPFLKILDRSPSSWTAHLSGTVEDFLAWLPRSAVEDLAIAPPDLESLFRRYYDASPGAPA